MLFNYYMLFLTMTVSYSQFIESPYYYFLKLFFNNLFIQNVFQVCASAHTDQPLIKCLTLKTETHTA